MLKEIAPIIKLENLNVIYNFGKINEVRALENIDLEMYPREYVIIFGPSGCGKSTLLYSIAGLQSATSGSVVVDGESIANYSKKQVALFHRKKIGMVFQAFHLVSSLNVLDNVCLPKVFSEDQIKKREKLAKQLLDRFSIGDQQKKFPSELSGGQKQRVSIARAIINNPDIILADEPVGNLDSKSSFNVMSILQELNQIDQKTIVLVTHDPAHLEYGDRVIHMKDGKIIKVEVVKKKKLPSDSFIFKDRKLRDELEKKLMKDEFVPNDLRLLMKAFKSLTLEQVGSLMVPFKAQQLFSHIFFSMTEEQIKVAKKMLEDVLYSKITFKEFCAGLDMDVDKGGAGFDKRVANRFSEQASRILKQANRISFAQLEKTSLALAEYLNETYSLHLNELRKNNLARITVDRLRNKIGVNEFAMILDMAPEKGGLGFDRRTSQKISREVELLILMRYSA